MNRCHACRCSEIVLLGYLFCRQVQGLYGREKGRNSPWDLTVKNSCSPPLLKQVTITDNTASPRPLLKSGGQCIIQAFLAINIP